MNTLVRVMRYLFWVLVLSWSLALFRRGLAWMFRRLAEGTQERVDAAKGSSGVMSQPDEVTRRLVRDPVCGTHVAEALAIPLRDGGEVLHFCSIACRDKYIRSTQRLAVNS